MVRAKVSLFHGISVKHDVFSFRIHRSGWSAADGGAKKGRTDGDLRLAKYEIQYLQFAAWRADFLI